MKRKNYKSVIFCRICNKSRQVWTYKLASGRGKYCSKKCYFLDRKGVRVSPRSEFVKGHPWGRRFKKGEHSSPATEFKKTKGKPKCIVCDKELYNYNATYCKSHVKTGERSPFWKGGVSKENRTERQLFMATEAYKQWRKAVFKRDNYTCQICAIPKGPLHADHIKPYVLFPELRLDIDNGRTLCKFCHQKSETWGTKVYKFAKPQ